MFTPERRSVEKVWLNRLSAIFPTRGPKIGMPSMMRSHMYAPPFVLFQRRMATHRPKTLPSTTHHLARTKSDIARTTFVGKGSLSALPRRLMKMVLNCGMMKMSSAPAMRRTRQIETIG